MNSTKCGRHVRGVLLTTEDKLRAQTAARLQAENALRERTKELRCLWCLSQVLQTGADSVPGILQGIVTILPPAWSHDADAVARVVYLEQTHQTGDIAVCVDRLSRSLTVNHIEVGLVEVGYLSKHPQRDEGPFLKEERQLLDMVTEALARALERWLREQSLQAEERRYRLLAENTVDVIWSTDMDLNITYVNPASENLSGHTPEEMIGLPMFSTLDQANVVQLAELAIEAVSQGPGGASRVVETIVVHKNGTLIPVEIHGKVLFDQDGTPLGLQGVTRDISEQKRAQDALRESEERHRHLFETMAQGSVFLDADGRFTAVNPAAARILGRSREELLGVSCSDPMWDPLRSDGTRWPEEERPIELALRTGQPVERVLVGFINPLDDDYRWLRLSAIPQPPIGNISSSEVNVTFEDVTALRQAEERRHEVEAQLQKSQRIEAIGRLAGGIAHDFNNMLSIILGNTEMALSRADQSAILATELLEIRSAAQKSAELTQQLLAFARLQETSGQYLDLNGCIEESLAMLKSLLREEIELKWRPWSAPVPVSIDPAQLERVLINLIHNARDAINGVGSIIITTELQQLDDTQAVREAGLCPGLYSVITLSDTGVGMDKLTMSRVFEPFFSTKSQTESSGLGLATVHGIVEQNGGFTKIDSQPGRGTAIRVSLPHAAEPANQPTVNPTEADKELPRGGKETILLVEDEASLLAMTERTLKRLGYRVLSAASPVRALDVFRDHRDEIDLLLTDVVMPHMNGHDMFLQMTALKPGLKSLFMSGYTFDILARRGVDQSQLHLLSKPFTIRELGRKVRELLDP